MSAARLTLVATLVGCAAVGCSTSGEPTIAAVGQSPAGGISPGLASVPIGVVLGFQVTGDSSAVVTTAVDDSTVASVAPTTQTTEFVLIGMAMGQTTLHVFVNNQEATQLPVQVTAAAP